METFDVWGHLANGRLAYRAVPSKGISVEKIQAPMAGMMHFDRVLAATKRQAVTLVSKDWHRVKRFRR